MTMVAHRELSPLAGNGKPSVHVYKYNDSIEFRKTSNVKHLAQLQGAELFLVQRLPG